MGVGDGERVVVGMGMAVAVGAGSARASSTASGGEGTAWDGAVHVASVYATANNTPSAPDMGVFKFEQSAE